METNEQLTYLSAYIHKNPTSIRDWTGKEKNYPWSSYQDYAEKNRWGELLKPQIILDQYSSPKEYLHDAEGSGAKEFDALKEAKIIFD